MTREQPPRQEHNQERVVSWSWVEIGDREWGWRGTAAKPLEGGGYLWDPGRASPAPAPGTSPTPERTPTQTLSSAKL